MSELPGVLGDYVTVAMAVELLGFRKEQTGRFYSLVKKGLPTYKVGGMTLARFSELAELAGLPEDASPPWPAKLADLEMEFLHSRNGAADILGVSPRTVNRMAASDKVATVDLSAWGGYSLYQLGTTTSHPEYVSMGDWTIEIEIDEKNRLNIVAANELPGDMIIMPSLSWPPRKTFVHEDEHSLYIASFRVARALHE
jgi:hypothetical protein